MALQAMDTFGRIETVVSDLVGSEEGEHGDTATDYPPTAMA